MGERPKFKDRPISQLALFCNAKEEILLNKKLKILDSMKQQTENSYTLDQRTVYHRFSVMLRRSEMAHAKLSGNQDLVKKLSQSLFPKLHTVVSDGSKNAVSLMLQMTEASRAISAPCRIQTRLAPVSLVKNQSHQGLQGKEAETEDHQNPLGIKGNNNVRGEDQMANRLDESQTVFSQPAGISRYKRPYTTYNQQCNRPCDMKVQWQISTKKISTKIPSQPQQLPLQVTEPKISLSAKEPADEVPEKGLLKPGNRSFKRRSPKLRSISRNLFLRLDDRPLDLRSSMDSHRTSDNDGLLNNKVKLFIEKMSVLKQEQSSLSQDYYSDRLLEKMERKGQAKLDSLWDTEEEERKWNPVGPESNHRSITIKKLDWKFFS